MVLPYPLAGLDTERANRKPIVMTDTFDMVAMLAQLTTDESIKRFVYDDATGRPIVSGSYVIGNPTAGIGRNLAAVGLSDDESNMLCQNDVLRCAAYFDGAIPWWRSLSPVRQRQMLDMGFNLGPSELIAGWPVFIHAMLVQDWPGAVAALKNSKWWGEVGYRGPRVAAAILAG